MASRRRPAPGPGLFEGAAAKAQPLAARMRPRTLDEVAGQQQLLGPGRPLRELIEKGALGSILLWGPPGTGKTTIARLVANYTDRVFVPFSAVTEGVPRVREVVAEADGRLAEGRGTILFVDEIHRLNRAQQDAFLPHVESGTITLFGATTENPSFEVNAALLSRMRVFVLEPLAAPELDALLRRALTVLEAAAALAGADRRVTVHTAQDALQRRFARYDKTGEEHFNILSAYHKSLRGSDPQGALYWMARMLEGGEDPLTIFRRAIAMASEDIGLADPEALKLAIAARDAFHMLGPPEGYLALSQMTIYLASAPKSNRAYRALHAALEAARETPAAPVPLHIRNAPTKLMKDLGYHAGYQYAHDAPEAFIPQEYLPDELRGTVFYEPGPFGFEKDVAKRMAWWAELRRRAAAGEDAGTAGDTGGTGDDPPAP